MNNLPTQKTVKFNVGGRHFEVSRGLIEQQPESMLARLISDTWHSNPERAIFIDRDGNSFAQVLNYLRDGNIVLPESLPAQMFTRDLDYYGLVYDEEGIKDGNSAIAGLTDKLKLSEGALERSLKREEELKETVLEKEARLNYIVNCLDSLTN